jgi:HAD superfamily hydrolase (TIGR01484 family)
MRPIEQLSNDEARRLRGLLFDLDDTLLDRGVLTERAYAALFRVREAGLELYAVTGRPAGWGAVLARQWPIDGVVSENGAIAHYRAGAAVECLDPVAAPERRVRRSRLGSLVAELRGRFPELEPADDVDARQSDFTFDIGERLRPPAERVAEAAAFARARGAGTVTSSVHLHVGFDASDKASGAVRLIRRLSGVDPTLALFRYAFIGDSSNDSACFAAFRCSIAVRNLSGRPALLPRFITRGERGAGFAEAAAILCGRRNRG